MNYQSTFTLQNKKQKKTPAKSHATVNETVYLLLPYNPTPLSSHYQTPSKHSMHTFTIYYRLGSNFA